MCQWKNFENQSIFGEDMVQRLEAYFCGVSWHRLSQLQSLLALLYLLCCLWFAHYCTFIQMLSHRLRTCVQSPDVKLVFPGIDCSSYNCITKAARTVYVGLSAGHVACFTTAVWTAQCNHCFGQVVSIQRNKWKNVWNKCDECKNSMQHLTQWSKCSERSDHSFSCICYVGLKPGLWQF